MQKPVRKAVFPVAGLGTRILPATKAMPKEMLTIVDKPLIQYAIEEARAAGIEEFYFVTGRGKSAIEDHFDVSFELEATLRETRQHRDARRTGGLAASRRRVRLYPPAAAARARPRGVVRPPSGRRRAVCGDAGRRSDGRRAALPEADDRGLQAGTGGNMVAVIEVPREQTRRYGVLDVVSDNGMLVRAKGVVEKPDPAVAPSTLTIIGRYIIQPEDLRPPCRPKAGQRQRDPTDRRPRPADRRGPAISWHSRRRAGATIAATSSATSKPTSRSACNTRCSATAFARFSQSTGDPDHAASFRPTHPARIRHPRHCRRNAVRRRCARARPGLRRDCPGRRRAGASRSGMTAG